VRLLSRLVMVFRQTGMARSDRFRGIHTLRPGMSILACSQAHTQVRRRRLLIDESDDSTSAGKRAGPWGSSAGYYHVL
jgi:hypothetical protein